MFLCSVVCGLVSQAVGAVRPNALFSDGAVLQRGIPVPVWGDADIGERVTVEFQGQKASTVAKDGRWMVHLKPLRAGGPYGMSISGRNRIEIHDMLVGEVWVASGQSNMQMQVRLTENAPQDIAESSDPELRVFTVPVHASDKPEMEFAAQADVYHDHDMYMLASGKTKAVTTRWETASPATTGEFSAVAYYFARELKRAIKAPVGIISSSLGATYAENWTDAPTLRAIKDARLIIDWSAPFPNRPSALYNGMIHPLQPYAIRGAIWYQGESNAGLADDYRTVFPAMIANWRAAWGQGDFPFLFTQIAPFMKIQPTPSESAWAALRASQLAVSLTASHTAMAVITDAGSEVEIHPKKKAPVGARLALAARAIAYGEKIEYSGPVFRSMVVKGDRAVLGFDHAEGGLVAKGGDVTGFAIAGDDGRFVWAHASIQGDRVVVSNPEVAHPTVVRFGWADNPVVNLYNGAGLPASPFRSDDRIFGTTDHGLQTTDPASGVSRS